MVAMTPSSMPLEELLETLSQRRRSEAVELAELMGDVTGAEPVIWAGKIIGFGQYHYTYDSGWEGVAPLAGFAPTARHHTVYLLSGYQERYPDLVSRLDREPDVERGRPRMSVGCLYLTRLERIDLDVLRKLVERSVRVARGMDTSDST